MPKKPAAKNAFYFYIQDFKESERKKGRVYNTIAEAAQAAGPSWKEVPDNIKEKYKAMASTEKKGTKKYTSYGEAIDHVEKREREKEDADIMEKQDIKKFVTLKLVKDSILSEFFYVMAVNSYCQTPQNFLICEFTIIRFNLLEGIIDEYHDIVHPGPIPIGYTSLAKEGSDTIGIELPDFDLPPTNLNILLANIHDYLRCSRLDDGHLPPLFVMPDTVVVAQDFIRQMCYRAGEDERLFRVYRLNILFFHLINSIRRREDEGFPQESLALQHLVKDPFCYHPGLACEHHEASDEKFLHCTTSRCKRLAYTILDYCCPLVEIDMVPGQHLPHGLDMEAVLNVRQQKSESIEAAALVAPKPRTPQPPTVPWSSVARPSSSATSTTAQSRATSSASGPLRKPDLALLNISAPPELTEMNFPSLRKGRGGRTE